MSRNIVTTYYGPQRKEIRINRSSIARNAILHAVDHLQMDHYGATVVDVVDETTGELHSVIKRDFTGRISILFHRDPTNPKCLTVPVMKAKK